MAIENRVILNGQIRTIREDKTGMVISLLVLRRPYVAIGNVSGHLYLDLINVYVRDKKHIDYLNEKMARVGDMLEVAGIFCTVGKKKKFVCEFCGTENEYRGTASYVHPLCIRIDSIHKKNTEYIYLTQEERIMDKDKVLGMLDERRQYEGEMIAVRDLGKTRNPQNGEIEYKIMVVSQIQPTDTEANQWLQWMAEISNVIFMIGNLCSDPQYSVSTRGERNCSYQVAINRKVFVREDDPDIRSDYPWIKSSSDQADLDRDALRTGSLVFVNGSIQSRENTEVDNDGNKIAVKKGFTMRKVCEHCGRTTTFPGTAMDIIPYSVEYLRDCFLPDQKEGN